MHITLLVQLWSNITSKYQALSFSKFFLKNHPLHFQATVRFHWGSGQVDTLHIVFFYFDFWLISKAFQKACWACEVSTFTIYFVHKSYFLGVLRRSARMGGWPGLSMRTCSPSIWEARKAFRFPRFSLFTFYFLVFEKMSDYVCHVAWLF